MRKNSICQNGVRLQNSLDRTTDRTSSFRGLRLPITCIAIGIAVLYCSERSIASLFVSGSNTSTFADLAGFASATYKSLWSSAMGIPSQPPGSNGNKAVLVASSGSRPSASTQAPMQSTVSSATTNPSAPVIETQATTNPGATHTAQTPALSISPGRGGITIASTTTNATWTGGSGTSDNWNDTANWAGALQPQGANGSTVIHFAGSTRTTPNNDYTAFTLESQILFDSGAASFTLNGNAIQLNFKIENNSASTQFYNMSGLSFFPSVSGGFVELDPTAGDLIVTTPGSNVFLDNNAVLEVFGSHVLRFNAAIVNGGSGSVGSFALMGDATVIFANANTYTGDTQINAGDLRFAIGGSVANSTIRLGGTGANSPTATVSLGAASSDVNVNVGSLLVVRPSASGTQGTRLLRSLNTSGSNKYSGAIVLDADLTVQSATGGGLLFNGGSFDLKNHVLTADDNSGNVNTQGLVTINEVLGSSFGAGGSLVKNGTNTLILQGTSNNYTGTNSVTLNPNGTQIGGGILGIYGDGSLGLAPNTAYDNIQFTGSATLQDTANNISLNVNRNISLVPGATATFDSNGNTFTINGVIHNAASGSIAKTGAGIVVLTGASTFQGTTTVNQGTLSLDNNNTTTPRLVNTSGITVNSGGTLLLAQTGVSSNDRINNAATFTFNGGTFNTGGLQEHGASNNTAGIGAVTLQSSSIIDMASGTSIIAFANSSANTVAWGTGKTLDIWNWSGTPITGSGTDQVYFGSDATGLTAAQLVEIRFFSGSGTGMYTGPTGILTDGEVVPVPEPSTWMGAVLAVVALLFSQRYRLRKLI